MKYRRFTITNYRAIKGPLGVDLHRTPLIPVIGINECGKTTILHAIVAFDFINDKSDPPPIWLTPLKRRFILREEVVDHGEATSVHGGV